MTLATQLRAAGNSWDVVGAQVQRSPRTCREWPLRYLNRLSDLFFVLGRWAGKHMGEKEYLWERGLSAHTRRR